MIAPTALWIERTIYLGKSGPEAGETIPARRGHMLNCRDHEWWSCGSIYLKCRIVAIWNTGRVRDQNEVSQRNYTCILSGKDGLREF